MVLRGERLMEKRNNSGKLNEESIPPEKCFVNTAMSILIENKIEL